MVLSVAAYLPEALAGEQAEYAYRVDGGFFRPWSSSERLVVQDPLLRLQGKHTIEVIARVKGHVRTVDPTPVAVQVTIDTVAPHVTLVRTTAGVRAEVSDAVADPESVQLSWSVDGEAFGPFGATRQLDLPAGTPVSVRARDPSGNIGHAVLLRDVDTLPVGHADPGGCAVAPGSAGSKTASRGATASCALLLLLMLGLRRRSAARSASPPRTR